MAGGVTFPGLGLTAGWDYGEDGWNQGMDENIRLLSLYAKLIADDVATETPSQGAPDGIYLITDGADAGAIAVIQGGTVKLDSSWTGLRAYVTARGQFYMSDGSTWSPDPIYQLMDLVTQAISRPTNPFVVTTVTSDTVLSDEHFAGGIVLVVNSATSVTLDIPAGLNATHDLTVIQQGAGEVLIGGALSVDVSFLSRSGLRTTAGRGAHAAVLPLGGDLYSIAGDLN